MTYAFNLVIKNLLFILISGNSLCHSARLAQRNLPATQKKQIKALVTKNYCKGGSRYSENLNF